MNSKLALLAVVAMLAGSSQAEDGKRVCLFALNHQVTTSPDHPTPGKLAYVTVAKKVGKFFGNCATTMTDAKFKSKYMVSKIGITGRDKTSCEDFGKKLGTPYDQKDPCTEMGDNGADYTVFVRIGDVTTVATWPLKFASSTGQSAPAASNS